MKVLTARVERMIIEELDRYGYRLTVKASWKAKDEYMYEISKPMQGYTQHIVTAIKKNELIDVVNLISLIARLERDNKEIVTV